MREERPVKMEEGREEKELLSRMKEGRNERERTGKEESDVKACENGVKKK